MRTLILTLLSVAFTATAVQRTLDDASFWACAAPALAGMGFGAVVVWAWARQRLSERR